MASQFSDNALTKLESLLLECQLENAHQEMEERSIKSGKTISGKPKKRHEMPPEDQAYIRTLAGNDKCADCGASDTEWASVSFGILLCTECSGVHRALGTHVSRVRSVKMDSWTDNHIKAMRQGGNQKCQKYLKKQGLDLGSCSIKERYESPVAQKYQQKLKKQIKVGIEKHPGLAPTTRMNSSRSLTNNSLDGSSNHSLKSTTSTRSRKSTTSTRSRKSKKGPASPTVQRAKTTEPAPKKQGESPPLQRANTADSVTTKKTASAQPIQRVNRTALTKNNAKASNPPLQHAKSTDPSNRKSLSPPSKRMGSFGPTANKKLPPRRMGSSGSFVGKSPQVRASAPTILYCGRSFLANSLENKSNNEDKLRINDELEVPQKLERMWYGDEDGTNIVSSNQSYASTSLSSTSMSLSSYFGGTGSNTFSELCTKDLHVLESDTEVKEYVRQQLLKQWNRQQGKR